MVAENNSSHEDVVYPKTDGAKSLHELAYTVNVDWAGPQPAETVAAHAALVEKHGPAKELVTAKDLAHIIAAVRSKCAAFNVSATEIEKIVAGISSNIGALRTQLDDITKQAMADANQAIGEAKDNFIQAVMYAEQSMQQQYAEMRELDKKIDKSVDELYVEGLISKDRYEQLKKDKAAADALPEGSAARIAADRKYNENLTTTLKQADEAANTPEQHEHIATTQTDLEKRKHINHEIETIYNQRHENRKVISSTASTELSRTQQVSQTSAEALAFGDTPNIPERLAVVDAASPSSAPTTPAQQHSDKGTVKLG